MGLLTGLHVPLYQNQRLGRVQSSSFCMTRVTANLRVRAYCAVAHTKRFTLETLFGGWGGLLRVRACAHLCQSLTAEQLTKAAAAAMIIHGHLLSRRADTPAATAPSNANSRNTSSTCGKCSHADVERSLHADTMLQRLSLRGRSTWPFSSSSVSFFSPLLRPWSFDSAVASESSSWPPGPIPWLRRLVLSS